MLTLDEVFRPAFYTVELWVSLEQTPSERLALCLQYLRSDPARWEDWLASVRCGLADDGAPSAKAQLGWHICQVLDTITSMSTALAHRSAGSVKPGAVIGRLPAESFLHVHDLPGSPSATAAAVSRAAKDGILTRIRHGLYFKGRPTRYGTTRPTPEAVAREVLGSQGVGPAGFSAARALGVTTQIPARPEFAIAGPKPTGLQGVQVHQRSNMARRNLSYLEIALLEVLRDPKTLVEGSWSHLVDAVRPAVSAGKVNMTRLQKAAAHEGSLSARSSLHRLLADLASDQ